MGDIFCGSMFTVSRVTCPWTKMVGGGVFKHLQM